MNQTIYQIFMEKKDHIFSILYPRRCPICDGILNPEECEIHLICKSKLHYVKAPTCMRCGRPIENASYEFCYNCKSDINSCSIKPSKEPFRSDSIYIRKNNFIEYPDFQGKAVFLYKGAIKKSLYRFKYANKREYALFFAKETVRLYGDWIRQNGINLIVPVPMYAKKKRKRGYNQAESFAKELSVLIGIPMDTHLVERVKDTLPQKTLNKQERKNNLKNAFQTRKSIVQYRERILVVDDIYTTGSTMEFVTACLKNAGVEKLFVLSIAIGMQE